MITPQEIREKVFVRARLGGYDMNDVDEFLDTLAVDYSNAVKESEDLKSKMRVLVEKISEYRQTEDSMRLALLSAQKMSAQIEADAKARAEALVTEAQSKAETIARSVQADIAKEQTRLAEARSATKKFIDHMTAVCQKQTEFYGRLMDSAVASQSRAAREEEEAETVRSIESSVVKAALQEPEAPILVDTGVGDEEEPTRMFASDAGRKKRRTRDDYRFEDED